MLARRPVRHRVRSVAPIVQCTSSADGWRDVYDGTTDRCRGLRWAWWACWIPMLANLTYSLTCGRHDFTRWARSLIADIGLLLLLLIHLPAFFSRPAAGEERGR